MPGGPLRAKIFKSSYQAILRTMRTQTQFVPKVAENYFDLQQVRKATTDDGLTSQQKSERWNKLKVVLFADIISSVYSIRIANMVSLVQMAITAKIFYKDKKA